MLVVVGSIASGVGAAPIGWDPVYGFASTSSCLLEEPDLNILFFFFFFGLGFSMVLTRNSNLVLATCVQ